MSLIFRPRRFKDANGDIIEFADINIPTWDAIGSHLQIDLDDSPYSMTETRNEDFQTQLEFRWNLWVVGRPNDNIGHRDYLLSKATNLSKQLRDCIELMECVKEAKGNRFTQEEQEGLDTLKEKLRNLGG